MKDMTTSMYFENELKKILDSSYPNATYVGRACFIDLGGLSRAKVQFDASYIVNQFDMLKVTVLNRREGVVDTMNLMFSDILGNKQVNNPNFQDGIWPHIWIDRNNIDWYAYHPNASDYNSLSEAVSAYLEVFQEPTMNDSQQWEQTM